MASSSSSHQQLTSARAYAGSLKEMDQRVKVSAGQAGQVDSARVSAAATAPTSSQRVRRLSVMKCERRWKQGAGVQGLNQQLT